MMTAYLDAKEYSLESLMRCLHHPNVRTVWDNAEVDVLERLSVDDYLMTYY